MDTISSEGDAPFGGEEGKERGAAGSYVPVSPELWPSPAPARPCSTVTCSAHAIKMMTRGSCLYARHPPRAGRYQASLRRLYLSMA